ncbi:MAG: carboxypeptidase regulatory-like domain-containing protein, partial [Desulfobacterales bacterium]|nr:carboxypeptidase regulatory-like domain-containing protein [Desulfobacterales bacterium]
CGSSYDTKLAVYKGCSCYPTSSDMIASSDDDCAQQSRVTFAATAGEKFLIEVGGYGSRTGPGVLTISCEGNLASSSSGTINVDPIITGGVDLGVLRGTVRRRSLNGLGDLVPNPELTLIPDYPEWIAPDGTFKIFLLQPNTYLVTVEAVGFKEIKDERVDCTWDKEVHFTMYPLLP